MEDLLVRFGPLAVLVGAAIEYDATLIPAGVVVHLGLIGFPTAVVTGGLGRPARRLGPLRARTARRCHRTGLGRLARVASFVERLTAWSGPWEIVLARFVHGTRFASMFFWGMRGLGWARFAALDLVGGLLGALILVTLGFALSHSATAVLGEVERVEKGLPIGAATAAALVIGFNVLGRRVRAARPPAALP